MNVTGRPAQFGRGVMVEVGGKLVDQFAANLAQMIADQSATGPDSGADAAGAASGVAEASVDSTSADSTSADGGSAPAAPVTSTAAPAPADSPDDSLNLVKLAGPAILKRAIPVAVAAVGAALLGRLLWRLLHPAERADQA
jgi:hypothetical protein